VRNTIFVSVRGDRRVKAAVDEQARPVRQELTPLEADNHQAAAKSDQTGRSLARPA